MIEDKGLFTAKSAMIVSNVLRKLLKPRHSPATVSPACTHPKVSRLGDRIGPQNKAVLGPIFVSEGLALAYIQGRLPVYN